MVVCGILLLSILLWCPWSIPRVEDQECGTRTIPRIEIFACIYGYQKNAYIINICIYTCIIYYIYIYIYIYILLSFFVGHEKYRFGCMGLPVFFPSLHSSLKNPPILQWLVDGDKVAFLDLRYLPATKPRNPMMKCGDSLQKSNDNTMIRPEYPVR